MVYALIVGPWGACDVSRADLSVRKCCLSVIFRVTFISQTYRIEENGIFVLCFLPLLSGKNRYIMAILNKCHASLVISVYIVFRLVGGWGS